MKSFKSDKGKGLLTFLLNPLIQKWVLRLVVLVIILQLGSWGWAFWDFKKMDSKIASITNPEKEAEEKTPKEGEPTKQPKKNGYSQGKNLQPKANIFKRSVIPYHLTAILGTKAMIDGRLVGEGEKIASATVESIGINGVVLEMEGGSTRELQIFSPAKMKELKMDKVKNGLGKESKSMMPSPSGMKASNNGPKNHAPPKMESNKPFGGGNFGNRPRGQFMENLRNMSDEDKAKMRERFNNMSPEEKKARRDKFRNSAEGEGANNGREGRDRRRRER